MGSAPPPGGGRGFEHMNWQYQTNIDPEELFKKIFGDFKMGFDHAEPDFAESSYGFGAAREVIL